MPSDEKSPDVHEAVDDKTPITPVSPTGNGETTPLRGSKLVDKLVLPSDIAAGLTQSRQSDSYSKFKNPNEVDDSNVNDVRIEFPPNAGSSWSLDTSNASSSATVVRWYQHPKVKEHWKVVVMSFVLFFIGLGNLLQCSCALIKFISYRSLHHWNYLRSYERRIERYLYFLCHRCYLYNSWRISSHCSLLCREWQERLQILQSTVIQLRNLVFTITSACKSSGITLSQGIWFNWFNTNQKNR